MAVTGTRTEYMQQSTPPATISGLIPAAFDCNDPGIAGNIYPRIRDTVNGVGRIIGSQITLQNGPIDLTTQALVLAIDTGSLARFETTANDGIFVLLADSANNFKTFQLGGADFEAILSDSFIVIGDGLTTNTLGAYESGNLDLEDISTIEFYSTRGDNGTLDITIRAFTGFEEISVTGNSSLDDVVALLNIERNDASLGSTFLGLSKIRIGDGGTTTTNFDAQLEVLEFLPAINPNNIKSFYRADKNTFGVTFDLGPSDTVNLTNTQLKSNGSFAYYTFTNGNGTYNASGLTIAGAGAVDLGNADLSGATFSDIDTVARPAGELSFLNVRRLDLAAGDTLSGSSYSGAASGEGIVFTGAPGTYPFEIRFNNNSSTADLSIDPSSAGSFDFSNITVASGYTLKLRNLSATHAISLVLPSGISTNIVDAGAGLTVVLPPTTFTASNLTTAIFNNVRCRLSLVPGSPATINDDGTVASGGINFATSDVNTASNTIALTGIAGKLNSNSIVRFYGSDLPEPIDSRAVYYPSTDYDDSNNLSISSTPGGSTISLTDVGSGSDMYGSGWTELDTSLVTSGSYTVNITASASTAGVTVANNDILVLQAIHHDPAGTGGTANVSNYLEESFLFSGANITSLSSLSLASLPMSLLAELGQDGSQVLGYSVDAGTPSKVQIDVSKTTIDTKELLAFYYYTQWTESGMRFARGNAIVENLNSIALRGELTFDAASRSVMSGPFTYRLDGGNIVAPESQQISFNWENTRAAIVETEVAVDLPSEVLQAIHSILYLTSQIPNISGGSGLTPQQIRDAMKLSPSAGTPATDSLDDKLDKQSSPIIK